MKNSIKKSTAKMHNSLLRSGTIIYKEVKIGKRFATGHNAIIREDNIIGDDVVIGTNSYLGPGNRIGHKVRIHTSCFLEGVILGENVIISPHVVFTNSPYPPCKICAKTVGGATVGRNTVIGSNVTVLPGIKIGENVLVGAGSVVTKDIPDDTVAVGNPAKIIKKISEINHEHGAPRLKPWRLKPPFAKASEGLSASTSKGDIHRSRLRIYQRLKLRVSAKADKK